MIEIHIIGFQSIVLYMCSNGMNKLPLLWLESITDRFSIIGHFRHHSEGKGATVIWFGSSTRLA